MAQAARHRCGAGTAAGCGHRVYGAQGVRARLISSACACMTCLSRHSTCLARAHTHTHTHGCNCVQRLQDRFTEAEYGEMAQDSPEHLQERAEQVPIPTTPPPPSAGLFFHALPEHEAQ
eukprot:Tamp_13443.p4 GENE.Tamp_13443~~Tamp_13443.p4  ORF type:complete len:119 (+),score=8.61 Tamp_13443:142-498(+)